MGRRRSIFTQKNIKAMSKKPGSFLITLGLMSLTYGVCFLIADVLYKFAIAGLIFGVICIVGGIVIKCVSKDKTNRG